MDINDYDLNHKKLNNKSYLIWENIKFMIILIMTYSFQKIAETYSLESQNQ